MTNFKFRSLVLAMVVEAGATVGGCGFIDRSVLGGGDAPAAPTSSTVQLGNATSPFWIALDSNAVYATSQGDRGDIQAPLVALPIAGGAPSVLGASAQWKAVAVDETRVYWSDGSSLFACDKQNCANSTVTLAPFGAFDIEVDATTVYWTMTNEGRVMKIDKKGGPAFLIASAGWPYGLAVDGESVYWIDQAQPQAGLFKAPLVGGAPIQLAVTDPFPPEAIALDADNAYFLNGEGKLFKVSKSGGPVRMLFDGLEMQSLGLATDGTNVYAASLLHGTVMKVPVGGGPASTLVSGLAWPNALAVDATNVYIADEGANAILKAAK